MKELAKFYYGNTPQSDEFIESSLTLADKDIRAITNAIKSVLPKDAHLETNKSVDPKTGKLEVEVIFPAEYKELVQSAFDFQRSKIEATDSARKYSTSGAVFAVEQKSIADKSKETKTEEKKEKEEEKEHKEADAHRKEVKTNLIRVIALFTTVADITRRILTSVMEGASKAVTATRQAGDYGVSYSNVRGYTISEKAFGMKEGTNMGAISDIQSKFGNVYAIDENALEQLAMVMGGGVKDLVTTGIGGEKPEVLMNKILDTYFSTAMSGKNSLGQYVGQEKARTELVEQLKKVSPQLAEILSVMLENATNKNSLYRGKFDTYEEMQGLVRTNRMGLDSVDYGMQYLAGQYVNQLASVWEDIKSGVLVKLSASLEGALSKIASSNLFSSATNAEEDDTKRAHANKIAKQYLTARQAELEENQKLKFIQYRQTYDNPIPLEIYDLAIQGRIDDIVEKGYDLENVFRTYGYFTQYSWFNQAMTEYIGNKSKLDEIFKQEGKTRNIEEVLVTPDSIISAGRKLEKAGIVLC